MSWDTIARTGRWQDSSGGWHRFTEADFDEIVKNFEPGTVPVCLGHPKTDSPAYGWVAELRREGELLQARYEDLAEELLEMLRQKAYKFKSMSLDLKNKILRHVGFLGAANPAIPGLGPIKFGALKETCAFQFSDGALENSATEQNGGKEMNIEELQAQIEALKKELAEVKAQCEALTNEKKEVEEEFAAYKGEVKTAQRKARAEALVKDGKLTPGELEDVLAYAAAMGDCPATLEFSAPNGKEKLSIEEHYWRSLEKREKAGLFSELSAPATSEKAAKPMDTMKL